MLLAEVSDKLSTIAEIALVNLFLLSLAIALPFAWRWLALLVIPVAGWWLWGAFNESVTDRRYPRPIRAATVRERFRISQRSSRLFTRAALTEMWSCHRSYSSFARLTT